MRQISATWIGHRCTQSSCTCTKIASTVRKPTLTLIYIREINDYSILRFKELLSYETWDTIFSNDNTNEIFNSFLDIYLKIFQTSFPLNKKTALLNFKPWLTQGIKNSCTNNKKLYEKLKNSTDSGFKIYYTKYCKILKSTIATSKRISKSTTKTKITWNIIKEIINKMNSQNRITSMKIIINW